MKGKGGVIFIFLIMILSIFLLSFVSAKKLKDDINVTIDFQTSQVIRSGDNFQASATIKNFNRYKPVIIKEITILDENNKIIETLKVNKRLKSLKNLIHQRDKLIEYSENSKLCKRSIVLQKIINNRIKKIYSEIEKQIFHETWKLNINDFKDDLDTSNEFDVKIVVKYKVGYKTYSYEDSDLVLISEPLPKPPHNSPGWYVGDQHMHSEFGTTFSEHPDPLEDMADEAMIKGLDWVIFTDHSPGFSEANEWEEARDECLDTSTPSFKCLYGQEMSIGVVENGCDSLGNSHYLAHPSIDDEFTYVNGYCGKFQCDDCRDEQTVINEINNEGGIGIIAHPYAERYNWKDWTLTNFSGLEIINSKTGEFDDDDELSINNLGGESDSWVEFLDGETNPEDGFIIGVAGSDAHHIEQVGHTFTYCYLDSDDLSTSALRTAYKKGNCVASTGPFLAFTLDEKIIGEIARVTPGENIVSIRAISTNEFGELETLYIYVNEDLIMTIPLAGFDYTGLININLDSDDKYIRMEVITENDRRAYTNPIWLDIMNFGEPLFEVKNNFNDVVAYFDDLGNLNLIGSCSSLATCTAPQNSLIVENSMKQTVAYIDSSGNLCLETDTCSNTKQNNCNPINQAFLIQNNSVKISYIDFRGNLCLTGDLNENI